MLYRGAALMQNKRPPERWQPVVRVARAYTRLVSPFAYLARRFVLRAARVVASRLPLCIDVGAGTAPYAREVSAVFGVERYVALDIAPTDTTDVVADACTLPFRDASADLVVSFDAIQHVPRPEDLVREVARVLRPGGFLIVTFPFVYGECDFHDYQRWTLEGMTGLLLRHGLTPVVLERLGGTLFAASCLLNWAVQHLVPGQRRSWRQSRSAMGLLRGVATAVLTLPTVLLAWCALGLDALLCTAGVYVGGAILATRAGSLPADDSPTAPRVRVQ